MEECLDFSDVLIKPSKSKVHSRSLVNLRREFTFKYSPLELSCVPVMAANMDSVGTIPVMLELAKEGMFTCLSKFIPTSEIIENKEVLNQHLDNFAFTIGWNMKELDKLKELEEHVKFKVVCVDIANGHLESFVEFCASVREKFPEKIIIAGNVCTAEGVAELIVNGKVDIVKCGIGGGSACTTRIKTGVGVPQFSCIEQCSATASVYGALSISDGGITCPGDLAKAFGAGADFVMIGGQFAGHLENPGEIIEENGVKYKTFYGMSSKHAMCKNYGEKKTYRTSEGRFIKIPYKGEIKETLEDFLGGLRSACTYTDSANIKELRHAEFVKVNQQYNKSLIV